MGEGRPCCTEAYEWSSTAWFDRARCAGTDPELFFPTGEGEGARIQRGRAKRICAGCQVRAECLAWAMVTGQGHGVWGGLTERERQRIRPAPWGALDWEASRP